MATGRPTVAEDRTPRPGPARGGTGRRAATAPGPDRAARTDAIVQVLLALGEGEITTYADVAATAGYPRHARLVGRILATAHRDHPELDLPWWRVVNATGHLRAADPTEQAELLRGEGVTVRDARVISAPIGRFAHRRAAAAGPGDAT